MAAARFPAKTPARTAPPNAHHLPVSEARSGRGRGGVSSPDWRTRMLRVQKRVGRRVKSSFLCEYLGELGEEAHESVGA